MGSSQLCDSPSSPITHPDIPNAFTALSSVSATCAVTNKIDIGKYFEVLKTEFNKEEDFSPSFARKQMRRSDSSGSIPSPRRKKQSSRTLKKRASVPGGELNNNIIEKSNSKKSEYLNHDLLSGRIVDENGNDHCFVSRQKSWDLSVSKLKSHDSHHSCDPPLFFNEDCQNLKSSYSEGDFRKFLHNNRLSSSKSCESIYYNNSDLHERHKEHAKLDSVAEQNRKLRRKYYNKERKSSKEKNLPVIDINANDALVEDFNKKLTLT